MDRADRLTYQFISSTRKMAYEHRTQNYIATIHKKWLNWPQIHNCASTQVSEQQRQEKKFFRISKMLIFLSRLKKKLRKGQNSWTFSKLSTSWRMKNNKSVGKMLRKRPYWKCTVQLELSMDQVGDLYLIDPSLRRASVSPWIKHKIQWRLSRIRFLTSNQFKEIWVSDDQQNFLKWLETFKEAIL